MPIILVFLPWSFNFLMLKRFRFQYLSTLVCLLKLRLWVFVSFIILIVSISQPCLVLPIWWLNLGFSGFLNELAKLSIWIVRGLVKLFGSLLLNFGIIDHHYSGAGPVDVQIHLFDIQGICIWTEVIAGIDVDWSVWKVTEDRWIRACMYDWWPVFNRVQFSLHLLLSFCPIDEACKVPHISTFDI